MGRILVTGTSGFLADRIANYLREAGTDTVLAPSHAELDITDMEAVLRYFDKERPDAVVHMAAISDIDECAAKPELSRRVNVDGSVNLARAFGGGGRFVFASTDQVYTGNHTAEPNRETDELAPENLYAEEKVAAEDGVLAVLPDAVGLRLTWMFDLLPGKMNFVKLIRKDIRERTPEAYPVNDFRGETYAREVAENVGRVLAATADAIPGGPLNFGAPAYGNSYETTLEAYKLIGAALGLSIDGLVLRDTERPMRSLAMDPARARSLGISFRNTVESVRYCLEREGAHIGDPDSPVPGVGKTL